MTMWTVTVLNVGKDHHLTVEADWIDFHQMDDGSLLIDAIRDHDTYPVMAVPYGWAHAYATDHWPDGVETESVDEDGPEPEQMPDDWADPVVPDLDEADTDDTSGWYTSPANQERDRRWWTEEHLSGKCLAEGASEKKPEPTPEQCFNKLKDRLTAATGSPGLTSFHGGKVHMVLGEWERLVGCIEEAQRELRARELHHFVGCPCGLGRAAPERGDPEGPAGRPG